MRSIPHVVNNGVEYKKCAKCKIHHRLNRFAKQLKAKDGLHCICRDCCKKKRDANYCPDKQRERNRKKNYGITTEEYDAMFAAQNGLCAICGQTPEKITRKSGTSFSMSVDHCHRTGRIRALLCQQCNHGLGNFRDNTESLKSAIDYIKRFSG